MTSSWKPAPPASISPEGPSPSLRPNGDAETHQGATETVSDLLEAFGTGALGTATQRAREVLLDCLRWAASATRSSPARKVVLQGSVAPPPKTDWAGLTQYFRALRRSESDAMSSAHAELCDSVRSFSRLFHGLLADEHALDAQRGRSLVKISSALASHNDVEVLDAATELTASLRQLLQQSELKSNERLLALRRYVAKLETSVALSFTHSPYQVDADTGLRNRTAFDEHLSFLAVTGQLFDHPPLLLLISLVPGKEDPLELVRAVGRAFEIAFPDRQDFLARPEVKLLALIAASRSLHSVRLRAEQFLHEARPLMVSGTLRAAIASNVPGEEAAAWYQRANATCQLAAPYQCLAAAAPARFEA